MKQNRSVLHTPTLRFPVLGRWTKAPVGLLVAISLLVATVASSQAANSPAGARENARTSGRLETAVEQTAKGESVEQEIKALQAQLTHCILESDTACLEKYFAGDYTAIHGDGKLSTKAQEIENFKSGATKYNSITIREGKIRTYGDTAVVNALASVSATINGKTYSGDVRNTRVWVKQNGNWKLVAFQTTRVVPVSQ